MIKHKSKIINSSKNTKRINNVNTSGKNNSTDNTNICSKICDRIANCKFKPPISNIKRYNDEKMVVKKRISNIPSHIEKLFDAFISKYIYIAPSDYMDTYINNDRYYIHVKDFADHFAYYCNECGIPCDVGCKMLVELFMRINDMNMNSKYHQITKTRINGLSCYTPIQFKCLMNNDYIISRDIIDCRLSIDLTINNLFSNVSYTNDLSASGPSENNLNNDKNSKNNKSKKLHNSDIPSDIILQLRENITNNTIINVTTENENIAKYYILCNFIITRCILDINKTSLSKNVLSELNILVQSNKLKKIHYMQFNKMINTLFMHTENIGYHQNNALPSITVDGGTLSGIYLRGQNPNVRILRSRGGRLKHEDIRYYDMDIEYLSCSNGTNIHIIHKLNNGEPIPITCYNDDGNMLLVNVIQNEMNIFYHDLLVEKTPSIQLIDIMSLPIAVQKFTNAPYISNDEILENYLGSYPLTSIIASFLMDGEIFYKIKIAINHDHDEIIICQLLNYNPLIFFLERLKGCCGLNTRVLSKIIINGHQYILRHIQLDGNLTYISKGFDYMHHIFDDNDTYEIMKVLVFDYIFSLGNNKTQITINTHGNTFVYSGNYKLLDGSYNDSSNRNFLRWLGDSKIHYENVALDLLGALTNHNAHRYNNELEIMVIEQLYTISNNDQELILYINSVKHKINTIFNSCNRF